ncbi:MAG: hypothetical protein ACMG6H_09600, partial [Acidobacteriota bacterium]
MLHRRLSRATVLLCSLVLWAPVGGLAQTATGNVVEYVNGNDFPGAPGGHFFYSSDPAEQAAVDAGLEGAFFRTGRTFAAGGATPVCRFYGSVTPGPNSHFLTVDPAECALLKAAQIMPAPANIQQWNFEGDGFNTTAPLVSAPAAVSCPAGTTMVLRAYNNAYTAAGARNPWDSNHRFARSQADIAAMVARGWREEGGVFCAPSTSATNVFAPSVALAGLCVAPRADPNYGDRQGTLTAEKA